MIYGSSQAIEIPADRPKRIKSAINVPDSGRAQSVEIKLDMTHARPSDIRVWLKTPSGRKILVRERGRGELGIHRVSSAEGEPIKGEWKLLVDDVKAADGGLLRGWTLSLSTYRTPLLIELDFSKGGLTASQKDVFRVAMGRLQTLLYGTMSEGLTVVISAAGVDIDGRGGILGQAGPTKVRSSDLLPTAGIMEFDKSDMVRMEINGSLSSLLLHEMAHVLGFGTLFKVKKLVKDGFFIGANACREYGDNRNVPAEPVPLEDEGGAGTAGAHWDEEVFGHELMTGYMTGSAQPLSRITAGAFEDLGYSVNYEFSDPYVLGMRSFILGGGELPVSHCKVARPEFEVV